ncbi:MAG: hypothetical protein FWF96_07710, partial [Kiritimatiellaeota bacterium]|nr:hypothetical protein [Kiritimatiellota bacterium]
IVVKAFFELRDFCARIPALANDLGELFDYLKLAARGLIPLPTGEADAFFSGIFDAIPKHLGELFANAPTRFFKMKVELKQPNE